MVYVWTEAPRFLVHGCILRDNRSRQGILRVFTNSEKKTLFLFAKSDFWCTFAFRSHVCMAYMKGCNSVMFIHII